MRPEFLAHVLSASHTDTAEAARTVYHGHDGHVPALMLALMPAA